MKIRNLGLSSVIKNPLVSVLQGDRTHNIRVSQSRVQPDALKYIQRPGQQSPKKVQRIGFRQEMFSSIPPGIPHA
jgi:hypothetical protein